MQDTNTTLCPRCNSPNIFREPDRLVCIMCGYSDWTSLLTVQPYTKQPFNQTKLERAGYLIQNDLHLVGRR